MPLLFALDSLHYLFSVPLALISLFLILVVLVQRGRGGGLTGALGGMGGQSAFGTKAGDLFTRITIVVAAVWILLSMGALKVLSQSAETGGLKASAKSGPVAPVTTGTSPLQPMPSSPLIDGDKPAKAVPPPNPVPPDTTTPAPETTPAPVTPAPVTPAPVDEKKTADDDAKKE